MERTENRKRKEDRMRIEFSSGKRRDLISFRTDFDLVC
jgi:hypothetical protein